MAKKFDDDEDDLTDFDLTEESEDEVFGQFNKEKEQIIENEDTEDFTEEETTVEEDLTNDSEQLEESPQDQSEEITDQEGSQSLEETSSSLTLSENTPIQADQVPVAIIAEIGRLEIPIRQLLQLEPGNMLDINIHPERGVDLTINGKLIGRGELIRVGDVLGVRILKLGTHTEV